MSNKCLPIILSYPIQEIPYKKIGYIEKENQINKKRKEIKIQKEGI
jgi:hypothetical protein